MDIKCEYCGWDFVETQNASVGFQRSNGGSHLLYRRRRHERKCKHATADERAAWASSHVWPKGKDFKARCARG